MTNLNQIFNEKVIITNNPTILEDITWEELYFQEYQIR